MKTLTMYRPAIQNALSNFDRYFESFFGDSLMPSARILSRMPAVDIQENDKAYVLDMELPGYNEKNIEVHIDGSSLTIASKQEEENKGEENQGAYLLRERRINSFSRSFKLPENTDSDAVSAAFKNGVLRLEIKKRTEAQKKAIQINVA
jgi:HSP20 family protein